MTRAMARLASVGVALVVALTGVVGVASPASADTRQSRTTSYGAFKIDIRSLSDTVFVWVELKDTVCDGNAPAISVYFKQSGGAAITSHTFVGSNYCYSTVNTSKHFFAHDLKGYRSGYITFYTGSCWNGWNCGISDFWGSTYFSLQ